MSLSRIKHTLRICCIGALVLLWLPFHQAMDATYVAMVRLTLLGLVFAFWPTIVNSLRQNGWIHPMRHDAALAFRWQLLGLVVVIECFIVKQVPALVVAVLSI